MQRTWSAAGLYGLLAFGLLAPGAALAAPAAEEIVGGLQAWLDETRSLEARFEQTLVSGALGAGLSESGTLYLARPGRMRWEYRDPERKTALLDAGRMQLYLAEEEQLIRAAIRDDDLLPKLLAGSGRLAELFVAELTGTPDRRDGVYHVRLVPRDRQETFEEVEVRIRPRSYSLEGALVLDAAGNRIDYRFSALRRNRALPAGIFAFEPPAGTEIIEQP